MPPVKQQVRTQVMNLLSGLATSQTRLYPGKRAPWDEAAGQMPGVAFYLESELVTPVDKEGRYQHDLSLVVEMAAHGEESMVDGLLLTMEAEVEQTLATDRLLGGLLSQPLSLVRVNPPALDTRNGNATAVRQAEYRLRYVTLTDLPASVT